MATIHLTAEDLEQLSNQLLSWKQTLTDTNNKVKNTITQMDGWRDPQYQMFLNAITLTHSQLTQYSESMEHLARSLKQYAQQQKETVSRLGSNIKKTN